MNPAARKVDRPKRARTAPAFQNCPACGYPYNVSGGKCPKCGAALPAVKGAPRAKPRQIEDQEQSALFDWADRAIGGLPDLEMLFHVPNGGARNEFEGARLKRQGVRKGVFDIFLDVARGGYHGLRIELKSPRARLGKAPPVSDEQYAWQERWTRQGYLAVICEGWDAARAEIEIYLQGSKAI